MLLLVAFSFFAGIVTILSPCILPILPIILSSAVIGGKKRPLGIVLGFVLSFTFFTLFLASLVKSTNISPDLLRNFSIVVVFLFGLSLLIPKTQIILEVLFSKLSGLLPTNTNPKNGFFEGIVVGISLGILWTPCVGPILASVIALALSGSVNGSAIFITLAYSLGTAIPMFAILYGGQNLIKKAPFLSKNSGNIQKVFGVVMILTAIGIFLNIDRKFQVFVLDKFPQYGTGLTKIEDNKTVTDELNKISQSSSNDFGLAPEIIPGGNWFNSVPLKLSDLKGKVVLIDFWTYTCINCIRTLPYTKSWYEKYKDKGFVLIGIHTPEFEFEKNSDNVAKAIKDFGITYPVVQDNNYATWNAYKNNYWPAEYLIDKTGKIRHTHFGEGQYDESEKAIQDLLLETGATLDMPINNSQYQIEANSPETYLGYNRLQYLSSPETVQLNKPANYSYPLSIPNNNFALSGVWTIGDERITPEKGSSLTINFNAKNAYLAMRPKSGISKVKIYLDGVFQKEIIVDEDKLYDLVKLDKAGTHLLKLEFEDNNIEAYAFTFG